MLERVSVIGLGKLGAPLAACLAAKGCSVIGVDTDPRKVDAVNRGEAPVREPGLAEVIRSAAERLRATTDVAEAVARSQATFIVVPTPSEPTGEFSLKHVLPACESIGRALKRRSDFHVVVLTSTVSPGSTRGPVRETLERASGMRCGQEFGLCYSPEFIALGTVIRDFLAPDFVLIGESDARSGGLLEGLYRQVCENDPPVVRMNFVNAELTKLAVNTFVTTKITFANMLARLCEKLPGADVDVVTTALGLDSRIGPKYLKGAVSYGGPCFPRDNLALAALARCVGAPAGVAEATDRLNRELIVWLADVVERHLPTAGVAGILGLAYKPDTEVTEEAVGPLLAKELAERRISVRVYDPAVDGSTVEALDGLIQATASAEECIIDSDVVAVVTPWPSFLRIAPSIWSRQNRPRVVIDAWRFLEHLAGVRGVRRIPLGVYTDESAC